MIEKRRGSRGGHAEQGKQQETGGGGKLLAQGKGVREPANKVAAAVGKGGARCRPRRVTGVCF